MSGETWYLILVIVAFLAFGGALAYAAWDTGSRNR